MMHTELEVYKSSMKLVKDIYALTAGFPRDDIISQMKRAVISVPSNISRRMFQKVIQRDAKLFKHSQSVII